MFSYFALLSDVLSTVIVPAIFVLFILEICISMLQAYIFATLISLYIVETV
jgi:F0F1-type ATP synthase membrane subunit a